MRPLPTAAWIGTVGAFAIALVLFYVALRHGPFSRYSKTVDSVLQDWYSKKFILPALACSMAVLAGLMFLTEDEYSYHSHRLISVDNLDSPNSIYTARRKSALRRALFAQGYTGFDGPAVWLASIDKSLDGHSIRAVGSILAEDIEIFAFILITNKTKGQIYIKKSEPTSIFVKIHSN